MCELTCERLHWHTFLPFKKKNRKRKTLAAGYQPNMYCNIIIPWISKGFFVVFGCLVVLLDEVWVLQQHFPTPYSNRGYSNTIATSTKRSVHAGKVSALYRVKKDAWLIILVSI